MKISAMDKDNDHRTCLICNQKKIYYNFSIGKYRIEKCLNCALMRLNPQPTHHEPPSVNNMSDLDDNSHERYFNFLEEYSGEPLCGSLLTIGYVSDNFRKTAILRGLDLETMEFSYHSNDPLENNVEKL